MLISDKYRKDQEELHVQDPLWGNGPRNRISEVFKFINDNNIKEFLDYGCGKAKLSKIMPGDIKVINYDPCVPQFSKDPRTCEYTFCVDVMEHIEYECLESVMKHIKEKTRQKAFVCVATGPSRMILRDGRNAHIIQEDFVWWYNKFKSVFNVEQVIFKDSGAFWLVLS
jgi:hypothetical protein